MLYMTSMQFMTFMTRMGRIQRAIAEGSVSLDCARFPQQLLALDSYVETPPLNFSEHITIQLPRFLSPYKIAARRPILVATHAIPTIKPCPSITWKSWPFFN